MSLIASHSLTPRCFGACRHSEIYIAISAMFDAAIDWKAMNGTPTQVVLGMPGVGARVVPRRVRGSVHFLKRRRAVGASQGPEVSIMLVQDPATGTRDPPDRSALAASLAAPVTKADTSNPCENAARKQRPCRTPAGPIGDRGLFIRGDISQ